MCLFAGVKDGEVAVFVDAVHMGESGVAQPLELFFHGGRVVAEDALVGFGDLVGRQAAPFDTLLPQGAMHGFDVGRRAERLVGIDEDDFRG